MKKVYICLAGFLMLAVMFSGCYYLSYRVALNHFNHNEKEGSQDLLLSAKELEQDVGRQRIDGEVLEADTRKADIVSPATHYTLEIFDVATGKTGKSEMNMPEYLLGLDREGIISYLNTYMQDLSLEEYQSGLIAYDLVAFSANGLTLKKTYNSESVQYKYCLSVRAGMVIVYYSDKKTVYEYTGISIEDLPEEEQTRLNYGLFVKDDAELYGILENYSS